MKSTMHGTITKETLHYIYNTTILKQLSSLLPQIMESLKTHLLVYEMTKVVAAAKENRTELTIRSSGSLHCPLVSGACENPYDNTVKQFLHKTFI